MSNTKRKREDEHSQSLSNDSRKQKKHKKNKQSAASYLIDGSVKQGSSDVAVKIAAEFSLKQTLDKQAIQTQKNTETETNAKQPAVHDELDAVDIQTSKQRRNEEKRQRRIQSREELALRATPVAKQGPTEEKEVSAEQQVSMKVDGQEQSLKKDNSWKAKQRPLTKREKTKKRRTDGRDRAKIKAKAEKEEKKRQKNEKIERRKEHKQRAKERESRWKTSEAVGGRMQRVDPLFSPQEDFFIIAFEKTVCVYSTATSLQTRRLRRKMSEPVSSIAFCSTQPQRLYISCNSGIIERWDWQNGILLDSWDTKSPIHLLTTLDPHSLTNSNELVYAIDSSINRSATTSSKTQWRITAHRLMAKDATVETDLATLLKYEEPLALLRVLDGGRVIVAVSGRKILVGTTSDPDQPALQALAYIWREIICSEIITSLDIRSKHDNEPIKKFKGAGNVIIPAIDIVVGGLQGAIFIYEDILRRIVSKEHKSQEGAKDVLLPRKLHWHRNAVSAVKWSKDGNYVISGGRETVLIIWQLDTSERQELPHLSATIESIVVSPKGSSYGIRLADNSAMILSTSELLPTFNVAGIQLPMMTEDKSTEVSFIPTVDNPTRRELRQQNQYFPASSSSQSGSVLLAVPAEATSIDSARHACFLQTFDLNTAQQTSRQALTRNNVTALRMGPESNTIEEPNVTHMQLSHDGMWLATVDEWMPPARDIDHLAFNEWKLDDEISFRREVYLKFWSWDEVTKIWELVSKIDNPQQTPFNRPGPVHDLCADPSETGFATAGDGGIVRMWRPQVRKRHGLDVRSNKGMSLASWSCRWTQYTPLVESATPDAEGSSRLALSLDGSLLAVALPSSPSVVHLLDPIQGLLRSKIVGLFQGSLYGLGIVDRYLIILSQDICVWDMIAEELHYGFVFDPLPLEEEKRRATSHLAVDQKHNTFAIAIPKFVFTSKAKNKLTSVVAVFDVEAPDPISTSLQLEPILSLLPDTGKRGFHCIDSAAEIRTLAPSQMMSKANIKQAFEHRKAPITGLSNIYGDGEATDQGQGNGALNSPTEARRTNDIEEEDDERVVSAEQLAEIFESSSALTLPPVTELFEKVALLFGGRKDRD